MKDKIIIEAGKIEKNYWRDLWKFRELFYILSWRDIKVRYKQTVVGAAWSVIRPFLTMVIFTIIFGKLAKLPVDANTPYAILVYAAMLPWQFFSNALSESSTSLIGNANLISKVYFPRLIIPMSAIITSFVDFLISFVILILLMFYYDFSPTLNILFLPLFLIIAFLASIGPGLWLTALNVKYRDFRYIVPFIVQMGLYISPVGFSSNLVSEKWKFLYSLNPMVGVIEGFRWCILGGDYEIDFVAFTLSMCIVLFFLYFGISQFRRMEKSFADLI